MGLVLVQRRYEGPLRIEIKAPGVTFDRVKILSGPSPEAKNTFAQPDLVGVREQEIKDGKGGADILLPAASVAALFGRKNSSPGVS